MSGPALGRVWESSPYRGATFLVHLAIGDIVNDTHDNELWTSVGRLAKKARVSSSTARAAIERLCADGYLTRLTPDLHPGTTVRYRYNLDSRSPAMSDDEGIAALRLSDSRSPAQDSRTSATPINEGTQGTQENSTRPRRNVADAADASGPLGRRLVDVLVQKIISNGARTPTPSAAWFDAARLLLTRDGVRYVDARAVLEWCQADPFWRANILSMPKFREKYDQLRLGMDRGDHPAGRDLPSEDAIVRHLDSLRDRRQA